jgi:hypothetical protein
MVRVAVLCVTTEHWGMVATFPISNCIAGCPGPINRCVRDISNAIRIAGRIAGRDISRAGNPGWYIARFQR